jgi:hypothetical protein
MGCGGRSWTTQTDRPQGNSDSNMFPREVQRFGVRVKRYICQVLGS